MAFADDLLSLGDAVSQGAVGAAVRGAGEGVTSQCVLDLTNPASGPVDVLVPRGTQFIPSMPGFQVMVTTHDVPVSVPPGGVSIYIPTLCGSPFGYQPPPPAGGVGYTVAPDPSPLLHLFDHHDALIDLFQGPATSIGMPVEMFLNSVTQYATWKIFNDAIVPTSPTATVTVDPDGHIVVTDIGDPPVLPPGVITRNDDTTVNGDTPGTSTTPGGTPVFNHDTVYDILLPQLGGKGATPDQVGVITGILWDGVDTTLKFLNQNAPGAPGAIVNAGLPFGTPIAAAPADDHPHTYSPPAKDGEKTGNENVDNTVGARDLRQDQAEIQFKRELAQDTLSQENPDAFYTPPVSLVTPEVGADGELKYKPPPTAVHEKVTPEKEDPFVWQYLDALWQDFASGDAAARLPVFFENVPKGFDAAAQGTLESIKTAVNGWANMTTDQLASLPEATQQAIEDVKKEAKDLVDAAGDNDGGKKFAAKMGRLTGNAMFQATLAKALEGVAGELLEGAGEEGVAGEAKAPAVKAPEGAGSTESPTVRVTPEDAPTQKIPAGAEKPSAPGGLNDQGLAKAPISPNEEWGTRLPYDDAYLDDPLDPPIDPQTGEPIPEGTDIGGETTKMTPEQQGIRPQPDTPRAPAKPSQPVPETLNDKGLRNATVSPDEKWGTRLPYDDPYLDDPLDPPIDPQTGRPIPEGS